MNLGRTFWNCGSLLAGDGSIDRTDPDRLQAGSYKGSVRNLQSCRVTRAAVSVFVLLLALAGPGCATLKLNLQASGLMVAYDDIKEGRFDQAMAEVEKLEQRADVPPEVRSEAAYVKARVLEGQKKLPEALAQYREVVATYPNTPDGYLSRKRLKELEGGAKTP